MAESTTASVTSTPQDNQDARSETLRYLDLLYPDPPPDAWLVVSWLVPHDAAPPPWHSQWFPAPEQEDAARCIVEQARRSNVYVGLGLRRPDCTPGEHTRGSSADVDALPGLWVELDHNAGVHAAQNLPTPDELLALIEGLPFRFSLLVDSGGGYHAYVLFKERWVLHTPEEHQTAALLLKRFQRTIQAQAAAHGWKIDKTDDLARVLRPAGTLNHKSSPPKPVTLLHEDTIRYNPSDIADAPWLAIVEDTYTPSAGAGNFPPAWLEPIVTGCAWLRHCQHDAVRLPEPEWYGMLGIVGRCADGEPLAHEWSARYPRYSQEETTRKLQHALADAGPRTCSTLRFDLGADPYCRDCPHWGTIKSPIVLGMARTQRPAARTAQQHGSTPGPEPSDPYACPELPAYAKVDDTRAAEASLWLDDYIQFSRKWAPRSYDGFHEGAALFGLSTTNARRTKIQFGPRGVYTSLYLALAARTSLFTKTTVADIALGLLRQAGLACLLADDDATPQAFLRSLTLHLPNDYADLPEEAQEAIRQRLAFAGQKGWFYEEWGQHLQAMMQKEGMMAAFRSILRRLDDHQDAYVYSSISRGRDVLTKPYVALLANVTPADLKPFIRAQSPLWRDGYIARFAFIAPGNTPVSSAPFPDGAFTYPVHLIQTLTAWQKRLGIPRVTVEPIHAQKGRETGRYRIAFTHPHKEIPSVLSPDVQKAFYAYDRGMHELMTHTRHEDLDGSYARFPMKALRIAGLLASLHDDGDKHTIWPAQWYRGQQIAERWRQDLHKLLQQVHEDDSTTREGRGEQRIIAVLKKHGALTVRDINRWTKLAHGDILQSLTVLLCAGVVQEAKTARTKTYSYVVPGEPAVE